MSPFSRIADVFRMGDQVQLLTLSRSGALGLCLSEEHGCHPERLFWGEELVLLLLGTHWRWLRSCPSSLAEEQLRVPWFLSLGLCHVPSEWGAWQGIWVRTVSDGCFKRRRDTVSDSGRFVPEFRPRLFTSWRSALLYILVLFQKIDLVTGQKEHAFLFFPF